MTKQDMKILLDRNFQLNCVLSDSLFISNISNLLEFIDPFVKKVSSIGTINAELITSLGDSCLSILKTRTDENKSDLLDELNYSKIFVGEYSEKFIEIMSLIQDLNQQSWHLDTYPTLELFDQGVRKNDQDKFKKSLSLLNNKLLLLDDKIKKNREFPLG